MKHLPHAWPPRHLSLQLGKWDRVTPADTEHCGRPFLAPGSAPFGVCALLISNGGCPRRHTLHQAEGYLRPNPISTRTPVVTHRGRRNSQTPFYNLLFGAAPEAKGRRLDPLKPTVHQRPASWGSLRGMRGAEGEWGRVRGTLPGGQWLAGLTVTECPELPAGHAFHRWAETPLPPGSSHPVLCPQTWDSTVSGPLHPVTVESRGLSPLASCHMGLASRGCRT